MKSTLKILGIICIVAVALFIVACGPTGPVEQTYTVTFKNGDQTISGFTKSGLSEGDLVNKPSRDLDATDYAIPDVPKTAGLYKLLSGGTPTFGGWSVTPGGKTPVDFPITVTGDQTLYAIWTGGGTWEPQTLGSGTEDNLTKALEAIKADAPTVKTSYALFVDTKLEPQKALRLETKNADFTIIGKDNKSEIVSPDLSSTNVASNAIANVFLTIGAGANPVGTPTADIDKTVSLTLKNIAVTGSGKGTDNSLIRVINGATLTLDEKSYISGHINKAGGSAGATGNGSAICIINESTLNIEPGAIVENNSSTNTQTNKNLVGGIFVIGTPQVNPTVANQNRSTVNIRGGSIAGVADTDPAKDTTNKCSEGNTADIYITEHVNLNLQGNVTIGELCINADYNTTSNVNEYPDFKILDKVTNKINKLNLRRTKTALADVQAIWTWTAANDAKVFKGTSDYDISPSDVEQFELWEFTGQQSLRGTNPGTDATTWANYIKNGYKIDLVDKSGTVANYGKLVKKD